MQRWVKKGDGFTIVELLIVVVVITILAAITIVSYNGIQNRAKQSASQSAASQSVKKIQAYSIDNNGAYPSASQLPSLGITNSGDTTYQYAYNAANPTKFCLTASVGSFSYFGSNEALTVAAGGCPGHSANGAVTITNLSNNPSFETGLATVSSFNSNISRQTGGADTGTGYARSTRNTTTGTWGVWWDAIPSGIEVGETYRVTLRARSNVAIPRVLNVEWRNASGNVSTAQIASVTLGTSWSTVTGTAVAPAGITGMRLTFYNTGDGLTTHYVDIDSVMTTKGTTTYTYADGSSPNWAWDGVENVSSSTGIPL